MNKKDRKIEEAVNLQMNNYPASNLQDIYKNFFQDAYGPGHLLNDTAAALQYLRHELKQVEKPGQRSIAETTGYQQNFVRVDLFVVAEGRINYEHFAKAFLESAASFTIPDIREWKEEWLHIASVIEHMENRPQDFQTEQERLEEMLNQGEYVVHHSNQYIKTYDPHYRIIKNELWKEMDGAGQMKKNSK